ncbi:MAG: trigger factor family protein, partial [Clostridia bacterium]|nr:trigger factor family protein [Clostridia bacterium]
MASTLVKKENNTVEFKFEISVDAFEVAMDKAFKKNAKYFNIPGFRKGKAPRKMVEKMYGEGVLYEDAINFAFPEAYDSAIDELQLEPVSNPELDIDTLEKGQPVVLIAKVTVKPEVTLGEYKGIEIKKPEYNVTAKDVNAEISR